MPEDNKKDAKKPTTPHVSLVEIGHEFNLSGPNAIKGWLRDKKINFYNKDGIGWCISKSDYNRLAGEFKHKAAQQRLMENRRQGEQQHER